MPDLYSNIAHLTVQESAATTLTFAPLAQGTGVFEKMAMIIHRIEYAPSIASVNLLVADTDEIQMAWTTSDQITSLAKENSNVIDNFMVDVTAAAATLYTRPWIHDFTSLPGGGLIVPATGLNFGIRGISVASPAYARSTMYFTYKQLKGEEFWELVEATRALTG